MPDLRLHFWGTRGSIPTPGRKTEKFGGNTTCLELKYGDEAVVFDAGSGIREMSLAWHERSGSQEIEASLLFTHLHWDHIQGFPFFTPAYLPGNRFRILGEQRPDGGIRELLSSQMRGSFFPVPLSAMQAELDFANCETEFEIGSMHFKTFSLPHPGGCLGFRVTAGDSTFVLATDCELDQVCHNWEQVKSDLLRPRSYSDDLLEFLSGADLLVVDCQYTVEEYPRKVGWGHNSTATVVDLCRQVQPHMVALFHHDPLSDDRKVADMATETSRQIEAVCPDPVLVFAAREDLCIKVEKPLLPAATDD